MTRPFRIPWFAICASGTASTSIECFFPGAICLSQPFSACNLKSRVEGFVLVLKVRDIARFTRIDRADPDTVNYYMIYLFRVSAGLTQTFRLAPGAVSPGPVHR